MDHTQTASDRSCSWTPRWCRPDHTSTRECPSSACHSSGGRSSSTTAMPTWLTGALVTVWMARSASDPPRNTQTSPVRVSSTAWASDRAGTEGRETTRE
ncbi:CxxxxCH/CxxCH domain-containing protein [Modestobacter sp. L9-4]|uniref:CxxxxCH/CxxCH domain-containing protein n=1 Tax=Modestobacter sp. L9-4 TaxID=2851567 RepID=UPI001C755110|nr:CxxxxCH/CxxCH domain-containing protein [Modestobacter sp. L9-4]